MRINDLKDVEDLIVSEANDPLEQEELWNVAQKLNDALMIADFKTELKDRLMAKANQELLPRKQFRSWWWLLPTAAAAAVTFAVMIASPEPITLINKPVQEMGSGAQAEQPFQVADAGPPESSLKQAAETQSPDAAKAPAGGLANSMAVTGLAAATNTAPTAMAQESATPPTIDQDSTKSIRPQLARMPALATGGRAGKERAMSMATVSRPDYYLISSAALPAVPASLPVWRATGGIKSSAEVMPIASRFGFDLSNLQEPYRFVKGTASLTISLNNNNWPVSLTYCKPPAAASGPALPNQQLVAAAVQFADKHGLLPRDYHATARMEQDNGEIEVFIQPRLNQLPLIGPELRAVVTAQGEVSRFECLLSGYESMGDYPLLPPAQAVSSLNAAAGQAQGQERQDIMVEQMELLYVWQDSPGSLPIIRPAYRLTGRDKLGQIYEQVVDAVDPAYTEGGQG